MSELPILISEPSLPSVQDMLNPQPATHISLQNSVLAEYYQNNLTEKMEKMTSEQFKQSLMQLIDVSEKIDRCIKTIHETSEASGQNYSIEALIHRSTGAMSSDELVFYAYVPEAKGLQAVNFDEGDVISIENGIVGKSFK